MTTRHARRIGIDLAALAVLYAVSFYIMAHFRVMEALLAPGGDSARIYVAVAVTFLLLRFFVIFLAPGWFLARVCFAVLSRPLESQTASADTR